MPTYQYKCNTCGLIIEYMHGMLEKLKFYCPKCKTLMIKQIGTGGYTRFIGSGFHCVDYPRKQNPNK